MATLSISQVLPNLGNGLDKTGFIFGAGTSVEAGYPMMADLTKTVIGSLKATDLRVLNEALQTIGAVYDSVSGTPNIEIIADVVKAHEINTGSAACCALGIKLQEGVVEAIIGVKNPKLENHVRFLELLKKRAYSRARCVYIFTTNYDVLFEMAGALANVVVETGFVGSVERFFDPLRFATACGAIGRAPQQFLEHPVLTVRLIKLHGSTSWTSREEKIFETHPKAIEPNEKRVMVLPRRGKIMETLQHPHDALFATSRRVLGSECKYLASCGFSFGDDHINKNLLLPVLVPGRVALFALCAEETAGMADIKTLRNFNAGFANGGIRGGVSHTSGDESWKFSKFVDLFE